MSYPRLVLFLVDYFDVPLVAVIHIVMHKSIPEIDKLYFNFVFSVFLGEVNQGLMSNDDRS